MSILPVNIVHFGFSTLHICFYFLSGSCTISRCRFGDFVASIALVALTRLQGYQSDWRGIQGVSGITNNNRYMFLKATRLSRRQEGWAGIGFSINSLFLMLLLSVMTIDHWRLTNIFRHPCITLQLSWSPCSLENPILIVSKFSFIQRGNMSSWLSTAKRNVGLEN